MLIGDLAQVLMMELDSPCCYASITFSFLVKFFWHDYIYFAGLI